MGYGNVMKQKNILLGLTPTASGFDTPPSNLGNCVDGNDSTATGWGVKTTSGAAEIGSIKFDLGKAQRLLITERLGIRTSANTIYVFLEQSNDDIAWEQVDTAQFCQTTSTSEINRSWKVLYTDMRYIRFRTTVGGAATGQIRFNTICGFLMD